MEHHCQACHKDVLARREARFDGFRKVGEDWVCTACGHRWAVQQAPSVGSRQRGLFDDDPKEDRPLPSAIFDASDRPERPQIFNESDRPERPRVFDASERRRSCGWCRHLIVSPFAQRCGLRAREVESTDWCDDFTPRHTDDNAHGN